MNFPDQPFYGDRVGLTATRLEVYRLAIIQAVYANPNFDLQRDYNGPRWVAEFADDQARRVLAKIDELEEK